jgi:hypothetical protein
MTFQIVCDADSMERSKSLPSFTKGAVAGARKIGNPKSSLQFCAAISYKAFQESSPRHLNIEMRARAYTNWGTRIAGQDRVLAHLKRQENLDEDLAASC